MDRYELIMEVGDGTFGSVWRALNKQTGEVVAIKKMKKNYYSWEECVNLREVKSLRKMSHPNIVKLKEVIRENNILYFIFEYMECNLYQLMKDRKIPFSEAEVRNWCFQVFQGLAYMHQHGYFHRDLKPENLLVSKDVIRIADFGLAREIGSQPPYTEYVSTRWYRAPEILLQSYVYTSKVDMWAMGAIMAELFSLSPLFPGLSEADEIYKICSVISSPTNESWPDGLSLARAINYQFPQLAGVHLSVLIPSASSNAISLISSLCSWDPSKRPTTVEALQHPFFQTCFYVPPSIHPRVALNRTPPSAGMRVSLDQNAVKRCSGALYNNSKPNTNFSYRKSHVPVGAGLQSKLDMVNRDTNNGDKLKKASQQQTRYRPLGTNNPTSVNKMSNVCGVSEAAEKLSNMTVGSRKPSVGQPRKTPTMNAGGHWISESRNLLPGRSYARKVTG